MHTFRYNPVFGQWVMLGSSLPSIKEIKKVNILSNGQSKGFLAAEYPKNPFLLEETAHSGSSDRIFADQAPLGEYELFLYEGRQDFWEWDTKQWNNWLLLLQQRLIQAHQNPNVHHANVTLQTEAVDSIKEYQRVGDLILTSHPLHKTPKIDQSQVEKIQEKEPLYVLHEDGFGMVYVPSAPTEDQEVWYLPKSGAQIEKCSANERLATSRILYKLFSGLHHEYSRNQYHLHVYTSMTASNEDHLWWIRIHKKPVATELLPIQVRPEPFVRTLALSSHFYLGKS